RRFAYTQIMCKAASAMAAEGLPLSGVLYGGLMKTPQGIKVIEFNARFGDPETEVVLPLLESDIYSIFEGVATGTPVAPPEWKDEVTMGVVLASKGYPGHYQKGFSIEGLDKVDAQVYHMGTALSEGRYLTNGGRVLMVVGSGPGLAQASKKVYEQVRKIECDNLFYRNDIAHIGLLWDK
ncbi:MAG: phosphoribosylamine--glycine ligase, partial [Bacteroidales bacterium]|nr:phosphoribosylamine--glycine ligase [Bacteroidales bacterium]